MTEQSAFDKWWAQYTKDNNSKWEAVTLAQHAWNAALEKAANHLLSPRLAKEVRRFIK